MDAAVRVFMRVIGGGEGDDKGSAANAAAFSSIRLLVASTQAINLIGKQGSTIKTIQESSGGVVRILPEGLWCNCSVALNISMRCFCCMQDLLCLSLCPA